MSHKYSANEIYRKLKGFDLTAEQAIAVEQASVDAPSLVIAGAGSGKTELMAVRVLWLVANGLARPEEILGLTFTRKAAAELSKRVYESLLKLRDSGLWPDDLEVDFSAPTISTYNAYANNLFRDFALSIGYEPEAALLTDAAAFQLARDVVIKQGSQIDDRLSSIEIGLDSIVEQMLALAQAMNENLTDASEVESIIADVIKKISNLPQKANSSNTAPLGYLNDFVNDLSPTPILAKLADAFRIEKHRSGFVDYSDQVALAERAVRVVPGVRERERESFKQILLDEYQDTSVLQTQLLKNLFAQSSVFAVGDPNQSIYGWRGASASNLTNFFSDFGVSDSAASKPFTLSTSWRNPKNVLGFANELIGDLKVLELAPAPMAIAGNVAIKFEQDLMLEAEVVADWFRQKMNKSATGALLMRKRSNMRHFVEHLENAGLAVEVVGIGGLLEMPEIVDLVSALRVIANPEAGTHLIRLLTGPRWRIGAKDIERLHKYSIKKSYVEQEIKDKQRQGLAAEDSESLIDALDLLVDEKNIETLNFSDAGLVRLKDAAILLRTMRANHGMPLLDFVRAVEQELWLDVEVQANPRRKNPMAHLNAFAGIVAGYSTSNSHPTLTGFLNWLDFAEERETFDAPTAKPEDGVVQVMTVHAAKGLEWDHVAIANLVDGDFPSTGRGVSGWISAGKLPFPLRGDAGSLPKWNYEAATTQQEVKKLVDAYKDEMRNHLYKEELRLMYVATTRPKSNLLLTGSYWKPGNKNSRKPSPFLITACEQLAVELPELNSQANPLQEHELVETWPLDPLGERHRRDLTKAAELTEEALRKLEIEELIATDQIQREIDLLLAERNEEILALDSLDLPVRIPASRFKDYLENFDEVAAKLRRPMPNQPYKQTRTGTLFHSWVEHHFDSPALLEAHQSLDSDAQVDAESDLEMERLQENFASSRWANQIPIDVEREIQLTIGENTFVCKLDAVFATNDGVEIIDWKTGKRPKDADDEKAKALQLALYRLAYSKFTGLPLSKISASFYFVSDNVEIKPLEIPEESELVDLWTRKVRSRLK